MEEGMISVIMGIYNCENTLGDALDSVIAQTYPNWELILCDDCSTDGTYALAKLYEEKDKRIHVIRNQKNARLAYSLNHCLKYARGEYIARMDGDDRSVPERFEKQVAYLEAHPELALVGTAMQRFSEAGLGAIDRAPEKPNRFTAHQTTPFKHATIMARAEMYDALHGYRVCARTVRGQDQDLWYRFFDAGFKGENLQEPLYLVREDEAAIRRRTPKDYWISFETTMYGYRLLHYPWYWYGKPVLNLSKALVPVGMVMKYREWQARKQKK